MYSFPPAAGSSSRGRGRGGKGGNRDSQGVGQWGRQQLVYPAAPASHGYGGGNTGAVGQGGGRGGSRRSGGGGGAYSGTGAAGQFLLDNAPPSKTSIQDLSPHLANTVSPHLANSTVSPQYCVDVQYCKSIHCKSNTVTVSPHLANTVSSQYYKSYTVSSHRKSKLY